jgi:hypothetical protein
MLPNAVGPWFVRAAITTAWYGDVLRLVTVVRIDVIQALLASERGVSWGLDNDRELQHWIHQPRRYGHKAALHRDPQGSRLEHRGRW